MEIWKDIPRYEGLYQASTLGNIKSLKCGKQKLLSFYKNQAGYRIIRLMKNNSLKTFTCHRIIATIFIPNTENKREVNHISGIKTDNRVENLEWCTRGENLKHAYGMGLKINPNKGKFGKENHLSKKVYQYSLQGEFIKEWGGCHEISRALLITRGNISSCCAGRQKTSHGFLWSYAKLH